MGKLKKKRVWDIVGNYHLPLFFVMYLGYETTNPELEVHVTQW